MALVNKPGMISLGGGLPNPAMFPFDSMSVTLTNGQRIDLEKKALADGLQYSPTVTAHGRSGMLSAS
jgi:kynurenine/2-aminoadipate aminotransferase